jgi:hypothetical protein
LGLGIHRGRASACDDDCRNLDFSLWTKAPKEPEILFVPVRRETTAILAAVVRDVCATLQISDDDSKGREINAAR